MKCALCEGFSVRETDFLNMFKFDEICPKCKVDFAPKVLFEIVPYSYGIIEYFYLYDEIQINAKQKSYLIKNFKILYEHILTNFSDYDLVIVVDNNLYDNFQKHFKFIKGFKKLLFVSLLRCNFEVFMNIF